MNRAARYKSVLSRGVHTLVVACVLAHWAASTAVLQRLAETDYPRIKALLGHEEWLDERGMFATPRREQVTWAFFLLVVVSSKVVAAGRTRQSDLLADTACTILGSTVGLLLALGSHALTYGAGLVFRVWMVGAAVLHAMVGVAGGMLVGLSASLVTRLMTKRT